MTPLVASNSFAYSAALMAYEAVRTFKQQSEAHRCIGDTTVEERLGVLRGGGSVENVGGVFW